MALGVAFRETYDGTDDATKLRVMQYRPGGPPGTRIVSTFNVREAPAGTRFHYASAETAVLGLVLRRAVDMPLADYLRTRIWRPMGAEADASWGVDNSGQETAQCCLSAVVRDWLRLGILLAGDGMRDGREIIPGAWVLEATMPSAPFLAPGMATRTFGYGYQTWLPGPRRQFMLMGLHGQAIFVDPDTKLVLVHTAVRTQAAPDTGLAELLTLWRALVEASGPCTSVACGYPPVLQPSRGLHSQRASDGERHARVLSDLNPNRRLISHKVRFFTHGSFQRASSSL
jgi:CubicO group peptidase (beta-lactamase class C family)